MLWYGRYMYYFQKKIKTIKKKNLTKNRNLNYSLFNRINLNCFLFRFYLPNFWKILIISKSNKFLTPLTQFNSVCYIYSPFYFIFLPIPQKFLNLKYDLQTNVITLNFFYKNNFYGLFWNAFKNVFFQFSKLFFKKLKFKGKGYYIYKNFRNTIALQFGYSHVLYLYSYFVNIKFMTKTSILIFGINKINNIKAAKSLFYVRPINIFTGKGIRFSRQIIYKKTGKISSYR